MLRNVFIALCLVVHTSHSCYNVLESTHSEVLMQITDNVTITCHYFCPNKTEKLSRLKIYRIQNNGDVLIGEVVRDNNGKLKTDVREKEVSFVSDISRVHKSFLSLTWSKASQHTSGNYWCLVGLEGYDIGTKPLTIKDPVANVFRIANTHLKQMEKKVQELESKINATQKEELKSRRVRRGSYETRVWPQGKYALFKTLDGCPESSTNDWQSGYFTVIVEYEKEEVEKQTDVHYPILFHALRNSNSSRITRSSAVESHFSTCRRRAKTGPGLPRGKYCIYRVGRKCPRKFRHGAVSLGHGSDAYVKEAKFFNPVMTHQAPAIDYTDYHTVVHFCCRSDVDHDVPIRLPVSKPFYLHRFEGECQRVRNAHVTEEVLVVHTWENKNLNAVHPDSSFKYGSARFNLCYYTKQISD